MLFQYNNTGTRCLNCNHAFRARILLINHLRTHPNTWSWILNSSCFVNYISTHASANLMAESVDPLKKSTKSESAITDPSRWGVLLFLVIFSTAWHLAHKREKVRFAGEQWDPPSKFPDNQNSKSGPKIWIKSWSSVIIGSRSESRIWAKIFTKSQLIRRPIHFPNRRYIHTTNFVVYLAFLRLSKNLPVISTTIHFDFKE